MPEHVGREKYKIFVDKDNILEVYDQKYPTVESVKKGFAEVIAAIEKHQVKRAFIDVTGQDFQHLNLVRKQMSAIIFNQIKKFQLEKVAITGTSKFLRVICNFMFSGGGLLAPKFFDTKEKALEWLKE